MIVMAKLDLIDDNPFNSRGSYDGEKIRELALDVAAMRSARPETCGLIHVPVARAIDAKTFMPVTGDLAVHEVRFQLAVGHNRKRAFQYLRDGTGSTETEWGPDDWSAMSLDVCDLSAEDMATLAWSENVHRQDLSPIERARALDQAIAYFHWSQMEIGQRWKLSQSAISNSLRLLDLPEWVQDLIHGGELTERHGRAILAAVTVPGLEVDRIDDLVKPGGDWRTVAELEEHLQKRIDAATRRLAAASWWADMQGWAPSEPDDRILGSCSGCPQNVTVQREPRCANPRCFEAKEEAWQQQVVLPGEIRRIHGEYHWRRVATVPPYTYCQACRARADGVGRHDWCQSIRSALIQLCPACWKLAGLPEPESEPERPAEPARTFHVEVHPLAAQPGQEPETTAAPRPAPQMKPASVPAPAPRPVPEMRPAVPLSPARPPTVLLTARILPPADSQGLADRRVLASIADEGSPPRFMDSGAYGDLAGVIAGLCARYFPENATEHEEILMEV